MCGRVCVCVYVCVYVFVVVCGQDGGRLKKSVAVWECSLMVLLSGSNRPGQGSSECTMAPQRGIPASGLSVATNVFLETVDEMNEETKSCDWRIISTMISGGALVANTGRGWIATRLGLEVLGSIRSFFQSDVTPRIYVPLTLKFIVRLPFQRPDF